VEDAKSGTPKQRITTLYAAMGGANRSTFESR
jgi:hypothetical protein